MSLFIAIASVLDLVVVGLAARQRRWAEATAERHGDLCYDLASRD